MDEDRLIELIRLRQWVTSKTSWRCPDLATVAAYADGRLEGKSQLRLERHLADCGHCLGELASLLRTQGAAKEYEISKALLARARSFGETKIAFSLRPAWGWTVLSTVVVLVVALISLEIHEPRPIPTPIMPVVVTSDKETTTSPLAVQPSSPTTPSVRSAHKNQFAPELVYPQENATIPKRDAEFRWRGVKGSLDYEVLVLTVEGDVVWQTRTESTHTRLAHKISLNPEQKYFVWVRADLPDGRTVKSSAVLFQVGNE